MELKLQYDSDWRICVIRCQLYVLHIIFSSQVFDDLEGRMSRLRLFKSSYIEIVFYMATFNLFVTQSAKKNYS